MQRDAAVAALNAGADILLMPSDPRQAFDGVVSAVENGTVSEERLNESVRRILTLKEKAGFTFEVPEETSPSKNFFQWLTRLWKSDAAA